LGFILFGGGGGIGGNALALVLLVLGFSQELGAEGGVGGQDGKVNPGRRVPVGPVVALLNTFVSVACRVGLLAGAEGSVVVADLLVSDEETLVSLTATALKVEGLGLMETVGLELAGMALAGIGVEGSPLSSVG